MAVLGDREIEAGTINVRLREGGDQVALSVDAFVERLLGESQPAV